MPLPEHPQSASPDKNYVRKYDLDPPHRNRTDQHGAGVSGLDSVSNREAAVGEMAYLTGTLAKMLIEVDLLDPNLEFEGMSLQEILDRLDLLTQ